MLQRLITAGLLSATLSIGCVVEDGGVDQQLLSEYRKAIPTMQQLQAAEIEGASKALGDPAVLPHSSYPIVAGINGAVAGLIDTLEAIVALPPTVFNSDTQEFVWGPFANDDGVGYVAVYIRDTGGDQDLRFHYAFLRGIDNDLAKLTPVIVGGATPSPDDEDHGVGLALYDFEANAQFELTHNPDAAELERGRIAFLFGAGPDENNSDNEVAFVISAFRDFVAADRPDDAPVDIDYLHGRVADRQGNTVDFLNWRAPIDVDEDGSAREDVDIRMAFLNEGTGRADATVTGGDLATGVSASMIECWDDSINQNFVELMTSDGSLLLREGAIENCGLFQPDLATLGVPKYDDIDAELRDGLDRLASTGELE